jgi:membrane protein DedA with SNARE-associated domain
VCRTPARARVAASRARISNGAMDGPSYARQVLATLVDVASNIGLPALFALIAVESMGVPLPGETALFTAAILASNGKLSIEAVIAVAAAAAILGDNVGYLIGRKAGRRLLEAPGPFERHRRAVISYGQPFFDRHGPKAVFLGRFVSGLRITAAWLAGVNRMRWRDFLFWNATGGIVWATAVGILAYAFGHAAEHAIKTAGLIGLVGAVVVVVAAVVIVRRRHRRPDVEGDEGALVAEAQDALDEARVS